jgi:Cu/Ag efflux protein CusF
MDAMTMRFPVADPEALEDIAVGDRIEATVVVSPDNRYWLEGIAVTSSAADAPSPTPTTEPETAPEEGAS